MAPLVPLVLATGAAIRGLRERNRNIDGEGQGDPDHDPGVADEEQMRRQLADDGDDEDGDENDDEDRADDEEQAHPTRPPLQRTADSAATITPAENHAASTRPSVAHGGASAHHWQRFYELLHPNFLHPSQQQRNASETDSNFPRTATWASDAPYSDYESVRRGGFPSPASLLHRNRLGPANVRTHAGRGASASATTSPATPAVSFQREVVVGGKLLHPQVPSILRSRTGHTGKASDPPTSSLRTADAPGGRGSVRPNNLPLPRTWTAESDASAFSGFSDTDGETDFSGEDEDDAADAVVGRSRRDMPSLKKRIGRGAAAVRKPSRALSTLILAGGSVPLRGWARRKQAREEAVVDEGNEDDQTDVEGQRRRRRTLNSSAGSTQGDAEGGEDDRERRDEDSDEDDEDEIKMQQYRKTPIVSGIMAPFSIMLEVPGFTSSWYLSTGRDEAPVTYVKNPVLLDVGLAFSMAFAVIANLFIILRFLEAMRPRKSTLVAIVLLTLHDAINIAALAIFGKIHAIADGFTYSEGYWMTMGSTVASIIVNCTLITDYVNTKEFKNAGSGLTRKQRELVIMTMLVLFYLSIGALVYSFMLSENFEASLYFICCTLLTIGFGDITPDTTLARIILFIYAPIGIILVALVIATTRETILEQFEESYKKRREAVKQRYLERQEAKRVNRQLRRAVRLRQVSLGGRGGGARQWLSEDGHVLPHVELALPVLLSQDGKDGARVGAAAAGAAVAQGSEKKDSVLGKMLDAARAVFDTGFSRGWSLDIQRTSSDAGPAPAHGAPDGFGAGEKRRFRLRKAPVVPTDMRAGLAMSAASLIAPARAGTAFMTPHGTHEWTEKQQPSGGGSGSGTGSGSGSGETSGSPDGSDSAGTGQETKELATSGDHSDAAKVEASNEEPVAAAAAGMHADPHGINAEGDAGGDEEGHQDEMTLMEESLRKHREDLERHWEEFKHEVAQQERKEFAAKMVVSGSLFLVFWLMGAGIFVATEKWNFFEGLYFGFVFFSTIGYGDFSPTTPSGRAFFIVWALFGVGILTVIFSVLGDAWGTIYKSTLSNASHGGRLRSRLRKRRQRRRREEREKRKRESQPPSSEQRQLQDEDGGDVSGAPTAPASAAGSICAGSERRSTLFSRRRNQRPSSIGPQEPSTGDERTVEGRGETASATPSEVEAGDIEDGGSKAMYRTRTMSSAGGGDALTPTTTTTPRRGGQGALAPPTTSPPEHIPLQLARAAMHLHSEASHLLESQRHVLADAVSSAPSLHRRLRRQLRTVAAGGKLQRGAVMTGLGGGPSEGEANVDGEGEGGVPVVEDENEVHRRELEKLEALAVLTLEREGDSAGVTAVRQLFALLHYEDHLSILIESSHLLRDTLLKQERELSELRAKVVELEARVEGDVEDELGEGDSDGKDEDEDEDERGGGASTQNPGQFSEPETYAR